MFVKSTFAIALLACAAQAHSYHYDPWAPRYVTKIKYEPLEVPFTLNAICEFSAITDETETGDITIE